MQARATVDSEIYACVATWLLFVFTRTSIITYQVFESLRYNLVFSSPSLDSSSMTHTRDTSDKRQLTYTEYFARIFFIL